jgi:sigma-B regulation protein RsbU (phosphoserine phosphatase)
MGHGVPAALYTLLIKELWEEFRDLLDDPPAFAAAVNRRIINLELKNYYFGIGVYGLFDLSKQVFNYCGMGNQPALHRKADGRVEEFSLAGSLVGAFPDLKYIGKTRKVGPGDRILFYTDGIKEVLNKQGIQFGVKKIKALFQRFSEFKSEKDFLEGVEREILGYSDKIMIQDDVTMVLVTIKPAS